MKQKMISMLLMIVLSLFIMRAATDAVPLVKAMDTPKEEHETDGQTAENDHFAASIVLKMNEHGFIDYVLNHTMGKKDLDSPISKGQFIALLLYETELGFGENEIPPLDGFSDMENHLKPFIKEAYYRKWLSGDTGEDIASIKENISREEALVFLGKTHKITGDFASREHTNLFLDHETISESVLVYAYDALDKGIIKGYPGRYLYPQKDITLGEAVMLIDGYNAFDHEAAAMEKKIIYERSTTSIYAGNRQIGYLNGPKDMASFFMPKDIVYFDGVMYIADSQSNQIREISAERVKTFLGKTDIINREGLLEGFYIDGRKADVYLNKPLSLAFLSNGDMIFTEDGANHIRQYIKEFDVVITLVDEAAGLQSPQGLAVDTENNIYVADTLNHQIKKIDPKGKITVYAGIGEKGHQNGAALIASFREPTDVFFYGESLYVLDGGNSLIRKIENDEVSTVAGALTAIDDETDNLTGGFVDGKHEIASFRNPQGLFVVNHDLIFIADTYNHAIRKIENGFVTTVAGGNFLYGTGNAAETGFHEPTGIIYMDNTLYVTDTNNHVVKKIILDAEIE